MFAISFISGLITGPLTEHGIKLVPQRNNAKTGFYVASQTAPTVTTKIDLKDLKAAIRWAAQYSSRSQQEVVNGQLLAFAKRAIRATKKASAADIDRLNERRQVGSRIRNVSKKTGKPGRLLKRPKPVYSEANTFAENIIIARFRRLGWKFLDRQHIKDMAKKMIAARKRSIAFIKSGWIPAIRALINWERELKGRPGLAGTGRSDGAKIYGKLKGGARPAVAGPKVNGAIWNEALVPVNKFNDFGKPGRPMFYAEQGLRIAERQTVADIKAHLKKKFDKLNKRKA